MKVINKSKGTVLSEHIHTANTLIDRSIGLLKYPQPTALLLQTRFGIHTFCMNYPIDVLILNDEHKVVAMKKNLKPNRIFVWNIHYTNVIELPLGSINKSHTNIHDAVEFLG